MKRFLLALAVLLLLAGPSHAITIDLFTDAPPGSPLLMGAGAVSGSPMTFGAIADAPSAGPSDNLSGWQLTLVITPLAGATGSVQFLAAATPASDYVFDGTSSLGVSSAISTTSTANDTLIGFDFQFPFLGGVAVDTSGDNLMEMIFQSSGDASGTFGVSALPIPFSEWTDSAPPSPQARQWGNVGEPTQLGEILIDRNGGSGTPIPEPTSGVLMGAGFALVAWRFRKR
jgi:hypothetical protein